MPMDLHAIDAESTITIHREHRMSPDEFHRFCIANGDWQIEQTAEGEIIVMPPSGWEPSRQSGAVAAQLNQWAAEIGCGTVLDSSGGVILPNGAIRAADAAWISDERLDPVADDESGFLPVCPEFVIEVCSPSDSLARLKRKMTEWIENGALLGWLIHRPTRTVHIYMPGREPEERKGIDRIEGEGPVQGFVLDLSRVWTRRPRSS
jgi:Uma2 family endonuclease